MDLGRNEYDEARGENPSTVTVILIRTNSLNSKAFSQSQLEHVADTWVILEIWFFYGGEVTLCNSMLFGKVSQLPPR